MVHFQIIGGYIILLIAVASLLPWLKVNDRFLKVIYILLAIASLIVFAKFSLWQECEITVANKCTYCSLYKRCLGENTSPFLQKIGIEYVHSIFQYSFVTYSAFVIGTLIAAILSNIHQKVPMNLITAISAGTLLPLCACGVFPLVKDLMATKKIKAHIILSFLFITPMLSPYSMVLSYTILGTKYFTARLIAVVLIAVAGGFIISSFGEFKKVRDRLRGTSDPNISSLYISNRTPREYFDVGYFYFKTLSKFILMGILIGSFVSTFIPPQFIDRYVNDTFQGLFLTVLLVMPLHLCGGQEVVLLRPLQSIGLSTGYQISFTIAAVGTCLATLPLFYSLFGKRLTCVIIIYFFVASTGIGYLTDLIT